MTAEITKLYPAQLVADLSNSGLEPGDIRAKPMGPAEKAATSTPLGVEGYAIPYFTIDGKPLPFYRVKLYDRDKVKYLQVADSPNHIYYSPRFWHLVQTLLAKGELKYILWTEGEKKAAKAVREGFPCVAVGGVDSWRSRTLAIPKEATISQKANGGLSIKMPPGKGVGESADTVATGFKELIDFSVRHNVPIIIIYDTDAPLGNEHARYSVGISQQVQRAAATLGFELRHRGVAIRNIRHLVLPCINEEKTGLDDYLIEMGRPGLLKLLDTNLAKKTAFPLHPNPRDFVNRALQKGNINRSDQMALALAVLSDLDSRGQRLRDPDADLLYYFNNADKSLIAVAFTGDENFSKSPFGQKLYRDYNLGANDMRVLGWLSTQFSAEDPIADIQPERVLTWRGDTLYYHLNFGRMVKITKDNIQILDNGEEGVLFESGLIDELDEQEFSKALAIAKSQPLENWWKPVLDSTRIKEDGEDGSGATRHRALLALLYYVSPWFYRWHGTQLPVEITWGEAGSGKSTLFELRLSILTGIPKLRNSPSDLKDWNASLASSGALHVTDNVQMNNNDLRNRLSDEICRLITEPSPTIEQRKLYSDTALIRIPVRVVFGITAIKQPFTNVDIIQRAIITELDKGTDENLTYDAQWKEHQLAGRGGRAAWLAHHLLFVQRMLQVIQEQWNPKYKAKYRLINIEQLLQVAATVVGEDASWIPNHLEASRDKRAQESDWTLEGITAWRDRHIKMYKGAAPNMHFTLQNISEWAEQEDEFKGCQILISSRNLKRYVEAHKHTVATAGKVVAVTDKTKNGVQLYQVRM